MDLNQTVTINRLETRQANLAGALFARIFLDDPLFLVFEPDKTRRTPLLLWYLTTVVQYCLRYGEVDAAQKGGRLEGMACWLPPAQARVSSWKYLSVAFHSAPPRFTLPALLRTTAYDRMSRSVHHRCAPMPHWYLALLGVSPEQQGQGIGSMLVNARVSAFDYGRLPCYLETNTQRAVALYQRLGFDVVHAGKIPGSQVPFWAMLRLPCDS